MANATNGPVDPDAASTGRSSVERARAEAAMMAGLSPDAPERGSTDEPVGRHRAVPATATKSMITIPAEPARKSVRSGQVSEDERAAHARPPAVRSTSSRSATTSAGARTTVRTTAPAVKAPTPEAPAAETATSGAKPRRRTSPPDSVAAKPARRRATAADPGPEPVAEQPKPARRPTRAAKPAEAETTAKRATPETPAKSAKAGTTSPRAKKAPTGATASSATAKSASASATAKSAAAAPARAARKPAAAKPRTAPVPEPAPIEQTPPQPTGELVARGIVELAAERLAASTPPPAPKPDPDEDPTAAAIARAAMPPVRRTSRSGSGARSGRSLPLTSRQVESPSSASHPEAAAPEITAGHPDRGGTDVYPRTTNRPPAGLPASVRLPAELPDNLWPPPGLLERHTTENLYVPAAVLPETAPARPGEETPDETPDEQAPAEKAPIGRVYVPASPEERQDRAPQSEAPQSEAPQSEAPQSGSAFLPTVLSHDDDPGHTPEPSRTGAGARHAAPAASVRMLRRRRRTMLLAYLVLVALVLIVGHRLGAQEQPMAPGREAAQRAVDPAGVGPAETVPAATPQAQAGETQTPTQESQVAETGPAEPAQAGEFRYAKGRGPMLGTAGRLYRFQVAVEKTLNDVTPADFAERIDDTLGDDRSWINDGRLRLRRVPSAAGNADFTIYLASAETSEKMCATGGLQTAGFTSCRVPGKVIINAERWSDGVPDYAGHLEEYRRYTINHEVGHELGHGHEACPGDGEKAPVMMQQTYGLKGCTRNSWPYLDGERYAGDPVA